ncbi:MAG: amidase family protein, partial [Nitrososphaeraceae archaeon]
GMDRTAVQYIHAHKKKNEIRTAFIQGMKDYDALLVPTTIILAPFLDQTIVDIGASKSIEVYRALSRLTTAFDITGLPAFNIPAGLDPDNNLPVGVQLVGRPFDEGTLLKISNRYDQYYNISEKMTPPLE